MRVDQRRLDSMEAVGNGGVFAGFFSTLASTTAWLLVAMLLGVLVACGGGGGDAGVGAPVDNPSLPAGSAPQIKEYYPQEGPSGSYVTVWFASPYVGDLTTLRAYYAGQETSIVAVNENAAELMIPAAAASAEISMGAGEDRGNGVPFVILPTQLISLHEETVAPAATNTVVTAAGSVGIIIPPGILDSPRKLTLARVENPPPSALAPYSSPVTYDVSIEGLTQLDGEVVIGMKYDPDLLDPGFGAAEQLVVMRWDEQEGEWQTLPYEVNADDGEIYAVTDHLSLFGFLMLVEAGARAGEQLLNDIYVTPQGNFRFFYSRSAMDDDELFGNDYNWSQSRPQVTVPYNVNYPVYIQDIGKVFEDALSNYKARDFKDPTVTPGWLYGQWHNPVNVKIDSYWSLTTGLGVRDPQYEKIRQRLHFPSGELKNFTGSKSSHHVIGHELFHRIQAEYYTLLGMRSGTAGNRPPNFWWLEATAEFAGSRIAWGNERLVYLNAGTRADLLSHPLNSTGSPTGHTGTWKREYEYAASAFVQFLVEAKYANFRLLVGAVAQGNPLEVLNQHFSPSTLGDYYAEYAAWAVFADNSPLKSFPVADFSTVVVGNEIAEKKERLELNSGDTLKLAVAGGANAELRVFRGPEGAAARRPGNQILAPDQVLSDGDELEITTVQGNEVLYLLAVNRGVTDTSLAAEIKVTRAVVGSDEGELLADHSHLFNLKGNYSARLWAVKIAVDEEFTIQFFEDQWVDSLTVPTTFASSFNAYDVGCIGIWITQNRPPSEALSGVYIRLQYPDGSDRWDDWNEYLESPYLGGNDQKTVWASVDCDSRYDAVSESVYDDWGDNPRGTYKATVYNSSLGELISGEFNLQ
ncbi:hypothetical protein ACHHRT_06725 [Desulfurivibrio sp. D14AmB]|uniref:hypothetical protein n=1 Tax=Desulfurivibrio sp. D14AmB TaxID=3374370 RepID=UPI00376EE52A